MQVIRKYSNRKLYSLLEKKYVTLNHLIDLVKQDVPFVVLDWSLAGRQRDVTNEVLVQALVNHVVIPNVKELVKNGQVHNQD